MATMTLTGSKWNVQNDRFSSRLTVDPRASVGTRSSTRYTPSVITFNANWAPAPLTPPPPLWFSGGNSASASGSGSGPSLRWSSGPYRPTGRTGPAAAETFDDEERVSHLEFDSDSEGDDNGDGGGDGGKSKGEERDGRYHWQERRRQKHEDNYDSDRDDDDYSPDPTPTQEQTNFAASQPSNSFADSESNAGLRAYLASYGFPDGLGYERPPPETSLDSSSSSSRYSSYNGNNSDDEYENVYPDNSKFAHANTSNYPRRLHQNTQASVYPEPHSELPPLAPSAWPASLEASNALLASLALDISLVDDPCGAWESLCWDELASESDSDEGNDEADPRGEAQKGDSKRSTEYWTSGPPSPYPVFRRLGLAGLEREIEAESDSRTISNDAWTENDNDTATATGTGNSTGTSTITAEGSEEWISLTGARAQAARARILPYRHVQVPFPTYPQADVSALLASAEAARTAHTTPVDPVLAETPPVPPLSMHRESGLNTRSPDVTTTRRDEEGMAEVLAAAETDGVAEGETAPHYGESGRDRLLTLSERDPPPYDLTYEPGSGYASTSGPGSEARQGENTQLDGEAERAQSGTSVNIPKSVLQKSSSSPFTDSHHRALTCTPTPRARSQLTFPTSPTDSDTLPTSTSPTSPFSPNAASPFSASPISPTATETTLTTPAGTYFSTLFPNPAPHPFTDSVNVHLSAKAGLSFAQGEARVGGESRSDSPPCPYPAGGCRINSTSTSNGRPRPLPPRPVERAPRTTVGTWLCAAGPYANGTRLASASGTSVGSWSAFGYGSGISSNIDGFSEGHSARQSGWRSPFSESSFRAQSDAGNRTGLAMSVCRQVVSEVDEDVERRLPPLPLGSQTHSSFLHHRNQISTGAFSDKSHSTDSFPKLKDDLEKPEGLALEEFKSSSESTFHIIPSSVKAETDEIGLQPAPKKHVRNRSASGSGRPLQRLATRCSTLTRRIGIAAGVGVVGRER